MTESAPQPFRPEDHSFGETRWFEDFEVGETFYIPSRTQTDALFSAFQLASGDNHPIHYDIEYCKRKGHKGMLAHAYQVMIQCCPGSGILPHVIGESLVAFIEASHKILGPVYNGNTLYPQLEVVDLIAQNTTGIMVLRATVHNQDGMLVNEGEQKLLLRKRPTE